MFKLLNLWKRDWKRKIIHFQQVQIIVPDIGLQNISKIIYNNFEIQLLYLSHF